MASSPIKRGLQDLREVVGGEIHVFITCASFEDRCLSIARSLPLENVRHALIARNEDWREEAGSNTRALEDLFGTRSVPVSLRTDAPLVTADSLAGALASVRDPGARRYVVDVTTFTHEAVLILLWILLEFDGAAEVDLLYTGAAKYMTGTDEWLSKGISTIRSVLGYPGDLEPSKNIHLIILGGFEVDRTRKLIEDYEPSIVSLGLGEEGESVSPVHFQKNREFHSRLRESLGDVNEFTFSCIDPAKTREAIRRQIARFPGYGTVVAPLNTKMSTLGAGLVAYSDKTVQLCYAQAQLYNHSQYSVPGDSFYLVTLSDLRRDE